MGNMLMAKWVLEDLLENLAEAGLETMPGDTFASLRETAARAREIIQLIDAGGD